MKTGGFLRRLETIERVSSWVEPIDLDLGLWVDALRARAAGNEPTDEHISACTAVGAALEAVSRDDHRLNEREGELVAACVNALHRLSEEELRVLAGPLVAQAPPDPGEDQHGWKVEGGCT